MEDKKHGKKIRNIQEFINKLPPLIEKSRNGIFYRGQSDTDYKLIPSVFRGGVKGKEQKIYLKVLAECSIEFDKNIRHIDIISKMQHYGVPTRLLDVTTNALVALYFACDDKNNHNKDGCVYIFTPQDKDIKQFDSDTVSILSSLPRFNDKDKNLLLKNAKDYSSCNDIDSDIEGFNNKDTVKRLLHEVKKENPAFENIINPNHLLQNYFIIPKKDNPRIIRQSGAFIIYGLKGKEIKHHDEIIIPKDSKENILRQLKCFGISKATLHPELYKFAEYINDCISNNIDF